MGHSIGADAAEANERKDLGGMKAALFDCVLVFVAEP